MGFDRISLNWVIDSLEQFFPVYCLTEKFHFLMEGAFLIDCVVVVLLLFW